jgi:hypothetical protein
MRRGTVFVPAQPVAVITFEIGNKMLLFHAQFRKYGNRGGWLAGLKASMRHIFHYKVNDRMMVTIFCLLDKDIL